MKVKTNLKAGSNAVAAQSLGFAVTAGPGGVAIGVGGPIAVSA